MSWLGHFTTRYRDGRRYKLPSNTFVKAHNTIKSNTKFMNAVKSKKWVKPHSRHVHVRTLNTILPKHLRK